MSKISKNNRPVGVKAEPIEEGSIGTGLKRLPPNAIRLQMAGDLLLVKCPDPTHVGLFRKFELFFESIANMERFERLLNYRFLIGLILTSHAKKTLDKGVRRNLFNYKNDLFVGVANSEENRKKLAFLYLVSPKPRVVQYCEDCTKRNTEAGRKPHQWEHCDHCTVDHKFFNLLSMHHKFKHGSATMFLSEDQLSRLKNHQNFKTAARSDFEEEIIFQRYRYNVRNLDAIHLEDAIKVFERLNKTMPR